MAIKRIFAVRINLDDLGAELDTLYTAQEKADWLAGFRSGSRGAPPPMKASPALQMGVTFGLRAHAEASSFQSQRSVAGQASAQRRANDRSTSVEHPFNDKSNGCSTDVERDHQHMFNGDHNHPISSIQQPISKQPSAVNPTPENPNDGDGHTLKFIRSLGGYLTFRDEDKRPDWQRDTADLSLEQIRAVFDWGRSHGTVITLPGKGPGYFGGVRAAMGEAAKKAHAKQVEQAEATARAEVERRERTGQDEAARRKEQANRATIAGLLATFDEDPTKWLNELATNQCNILSKLRESFNKRKPLALLMRHLEGLPSVLVEQAKSRAGEFTETHEGAPV